MDEVKNKLVVYTAVFGNYDNLIDPKENYDGCDFICFTDQKHFQSNIWQIRIVENIDLTLNMMNRKYKLKPHIFLKNYEQSLYVDTNIAIVGNPIDLFQKYLQYSDFCVPKHFLSSCIYEEAIKCMISGKSNIKETKKQIKKYKHDEFPENFGMGENGIILRNHNKKAVINIMTDWWYELSTQTQRDQLSLGYILWRNQEDFFYMNESARNDTGYFEYKQHKIKKNILEKIKYKISVYFRTLLVKIL